MAAVLCLALPLVEIGPLLAEATPATADFLVTPSELFSIPENLGAIPGNPAIALSNKTPTVLLIQDAHNQFEAQQNIEKLLHFLSERHGFKTIFLEGAFEGAVSPHLLKFFSDRSLNERIATRLLSEGEIGGGELFLLRSQGATRARGVENPALYKANLDSFRKLYAHKKISDACLARLERHLYTLASKFSNSTLQKLLKDWLLNQRDPNFTGAYLETLGRLAKIYLGLDLREPAHQNSFPQLLRYYKLTDIAVKIERARGQKVFVSEKNLLLQWLQNNDFPKDTQEIFESVFQGEENELLPKDIRSLLEHFYEKAHKRGFRFDDYPQTGSLLGSLMLRQELKALDLSEEVEALTNNLFDRLTQSKEEAALLNLFRDFSTLKNLFALELNKNDWLNISKRKEDFLPTAFQNRLYSVQKNTDTKTSIKFMDALFEEAIRFYEIAEARDRIISKSVTRHLKNLGERKAVLIAGGFHSEGLKTELRKNKIAVYEITPKMNSAGPQATYIKQMLLGRPGVTTLKPISPGAISLPKIRQLFGEHDFRFHRTNLLSAIQAEMPAISDYEAGQGFYEQAIAMEEIRRSGFGAQAPGETAGPNDRGAKGAGLPQRDKLRVRDFFTKPLLRLGYIAFLNLVIIPLTVAAPIILLEWPLGFAPTSIKSQLIVSLAFIPLIELAAYVGHKMFDNRAHLKISFLRKMSERLRSEVRLLNILKRTWKFRVVLAPAAIFLVLTMTGINPAGFAAWLALFFISVSSLIYFDHKVEKAFPAFRVAKSPLINPVWQFVEKIPFVYLHFTWAKFYYLPWFFLIWPWSVEPAGSDRFTIHGLRKTPAAERALTDTVQGIPASGAHRNLFFHPWIPHPDMYAMGIYTKWFHQTIFGNYFSLNEGGSEQTILPHEIAHQIYFSSLFSEFRERWETRYDEYRKDTKGFVISSYSLQDKYEAFAEWFVDFYRNAGYRLTKDFLNHADAAQQEMWLIIAQAFIEMHDGNAFLKVNFPETKTSFLIPVNLEDGRITLNELIKALNEARARQLKFISGHIHLPGNSASLMKLLESVNTQPEGDLSLLLLSWAKLIGKEALLTMEPNEEELVRLLSDFTLNNSVRQGVSIAAEILGKIGNEQAVKILGQLLTQESVKNVKPQEVNIARRVARILSVIETPAAKQALSSSIAELIRTRSLFSLGSPERERFDLGIALVAIVRYDLSEEDQSFLEEIKKLHRDTSSFANDKNIIHQYLHEIELRKAKAEKEDTESGFGVSREAILAVAAVAGGILRNQEFLRLTPGAHKTDAPYKPALPPAGDHLILLTNPSDATDLPLRISVGFAKTPLLDNPSLRILINLLARNPLAHVRIETPAGMNYRELESEVREAVLDLRKQIGVENRNVSLQMANGPLSLKKFVGDRYIKTLVYDARREVLETLREARHVFLVENDVHGRTGTLLDLEALALLNAIDQLFINSAPPRGIQKALDLLRFSENLSIRLRAETLFKRAA